MLTQQKTQCYPCWVRWQHADDFLPWLNPPAPGREARWADAQGQVSLFKTLPALAALARQLGEQLAAEPPMLLKLDAVAEWLKDAEKRLSRECLAAWNLFDDLSAGVGEPFASSQKTPARDLVFDLLYADSGPWRQPAAGHWPPAARVLLRTILTQGFALWHKHACWQA